MVSGVGLTVGGAETCVHSFPVQGSKTYKMTGSMVGMGLGDRGEENTVKN